jgi:hydroxymethylpyrimidine pyrophosphatase-like HAD family hydrolase
LSSRLAHVSLASIDLVVTDLDGTLFDGNGGSHTRTVDALRTLASRGLPVLAATARRPAAAADVMRAHEVLLPAVLFDGALGRDLATNARFHRAPLNRSDCLALIDTLAAHGLEPCLNIDSDGQDFLVGARPSTHPRHLVYNERRLCRVDIRTVAAELDVLSLIICGRDREVLEPALRDLGDWGDGVISADRTYGGHSLSIRRRGINKWSGVEAFCRGRGLDETRVLAVGDGENDVELLSRAAVACVPEDGCEAALALATYRIPPARDGGWADILDYLAL